ncbi:NAD(P)/FAD-dependent oxidoreductase [Phaeocystidibacter luteus]|uniref:FAD-binding oxidoreductase n=1 Tax=Phaeocystidibacter luteus TaxID=911197 RepID=A0A6N6RH34_9FLAO|nr:FAD-binding oxidoreductase [Phaeocystidibacter luteus]KAB2813676.1 FAD-binding oxidoreductase [Phaeocystidibacter luteus]
MKDYLIIGQGIAGTTLSFELYKRGLSFDVVDHVKPSTASKVASGLYNPLVLKRRRVVWQAHAMLNALLPFYREMERLTNSNFLQHKPVWEILPDPGTENDWDALSEKPKFEELIGEIIPNPNPRIRAHKLGEVSGSGRVNVEGMIEAWKAFLSSQDSFIEDQVKMADLDYKHVWTWNGNQYSNIIWCNGFVSANAHFPHLPFSPTKGEVLIVKAPELKLDHILHGNMFIMPWGGDLYKVGATYSWDQLDTEPTTKGEEQLVEAWSKLVDCPFEIVKHEAGVRPNVKDRKPLLGRSDEIPNSYIFNGLGSRGILMAPWLANHMVNYLTDGTNLPPEVNISRFS